IVVTREVCDAKENADNDNNKDAVSGTVTREAIVNDAIVPPAKDLSSDKNENPGSTKEIVNMKDVSIVDDHTLTEKKNKQVDTTLQSDSLNESSTIISDELVAAPKATVEEPD
ncbi:hypothetical protein ABG067_009369, partial [Albugo candida]